MLHESGRVGGVSGGQGVLREQEEPDQDHEDGERAAQASCDEFGAFVFDDVTAGPQQLSIEAADLCVELPSFDVGAST